MVIVFDLGKVIVDFNLMKISRALSALCGAGETDIAAFLFENEFSRSYDRGTISSEEFFETLRARFSIPITMHAFKPIWNEIFTPIPGMEALVTSIKKTHRVGLLSNTNKLHFDYIIETYPVVRGMDWFLSYELHLMKPEEEIYRKVVEFYRRDPSDIFFTDDLAPNIAGARRAGLHAVQFESPQQLRRELAARNILA